MTQGHKSDKHVSKMSIFVKTKNSMYDEYGESFKEDMINELVVKVLNYTKSDKQIISNLKYLQSPFGFVIPLIEDDKYRLTSKEGLKLQIKNFNSPQGLIFYITIIEGKATINRMAINLRDYVNYKRI